MSNRKRWKPGPGWKRHNTNPSVAIHENGTKVHSLGIVQLPDGRCIHGGIWPEVLALDFCMKVTGSRKRGLLVWANLVFLSGGTLSMPARFFEGKINT